MTPSFTDISTFVFTSYPIDGKGKKDGYGLLLSIVQLTLILHSTLVKTAKRAMKEDLDASKKGGFSNTVNKIVLLLHFLLLCFLILVVWVTLSLPLIFFRMQPEISVNTTDLTIVAATCSENNEILQYNSDVCLFELTEALLYHNCSPPSSKGVLMSSERAEQAQLVLNGLEFLNPSQECREEAISFLCLQLLEVCSSTGILLQPTYDQCVKIRDDLCARELREAATFNFELPDCNVLPLRAPSCENSDGNNPKINDTDDQLRLEVIDTDGDGIKCREGFYKVNNTKCFPSCHTWSYYSQVDTTITDILVIFFSVVGFSVSIIAIVLSCLFHRRMWEFPLILIIYKVTGTMIIGIILEYTTVQLTLWWLFHIIMLFFKIIYPFHEISMGKSRKVKYLHIIFVSVGLVIPSIPIIASMVDFAINLQSSPSTEVTFLSGGLGFGINTFPPIVCFGKDREVVFYSYILLIEVCTAAGCTLLLIIIWSLHRKHIQRRKTNDYNSPLIGKPEIKLLIVCIYYIILVAVSLSALTLLIRNSEALREALVKYFSCELGGHDPNDPCSRDDLEKILYPYLSAFSFVFTGLFPVFNLIYIVNTEEIRKTVMKWRRTMKFQDIQLTSTKLNTSFKK